MKTTASIQDLSRQIEQVIQDHLAASQRAAAAALERAFATATGGSPRQARRPSSGKNTRRRPPAEITGLAERLYHAVCAKPGEAMGAFAADLGVPASELYRPMTKLKRDGQVRSVGRRHLMRYFPMVSKAAESA